MHTQERNDILSIMAQDVETVLISPGGYFVDNESIWQDFLVGRIRAAYERIDLIADSVEYRHFRTGDAGLGAAGRGLEAGTCALFSQR